MCFYKINLVLAISLLLLIGCSEIYEEYDFKSMENDLG